MNSLSFFGGLIFVMPACAVLAAPPPKIVLIAGPLDDHPAGSHEYEKSALLLKHCLETSPNLPKVRAEVHFAGWPKDDRTLDDAATIVLIAAGSDRKETDHPLFNGNHFEVIAKQMRRGCGLVTYHWTTFSPLRAKDQILDWTGGFFDYESGTGTPPWASKIEVKTWDCQPVTPGHPINRGVKPFRLEEEFYHHLRFADGNPRWKPLMAVGDPADHNNITAWCIERTGGGRGFGFSGGHYYKDWEVPEFRKFVLNAIAWTARIDVPPGGIESTTTAIPETRPPPPDPPPGGGSSKNSKLTSSNEAPRIKIQYRLVDDSRSI